MVCLDYWIGKELVILDGTLRIFYSGMSSRIPDFLLSFVGKGLGQALSCWFLRTLFAGLADVSSESTRVLGIGSWFMFTELVEYHGGREVSII